MRSRHSGIFITDDSFSSAMIADQTLWEGSPKSLETPLKDSPFPILKKIILKSLFSQNDRFLLRS